jgi:hypothetical protein
MQLGCNWPLFATCLFFCIWELEYNNHLDFIEDLNSSFEHHLGVSGSLVFSRVNHRNWLLSEQVMHGYPEIKRLDCLLLIDAPVTGVLLTSLQAVFPALMPLQHAMLAESSRRFQ